MISAFGWSVLAIMAGYLALFFLAGRIAAQAAGRGIWLFARSRGRAALAAFGFRAAFVLALIGPPVLYGPGEAAIQPGTGAWFAGLAGVMLAAAGAMLAFAAQVSMGASWRVGVQEGETGALVREGLFRFSRNPTFLGQLWLFAGMALALPEAPVLAGLVLFFVSASLQIRAEEAVLAKSFGRDYDEFRRLVPRWAGFVKG